jgi:hypothetical protein
VFGCRSFPISFGELQRENDILKIKIKEQEQYIFKLQEEIRLLKDAKRTQREN